MKKNFLITLILTSAILLAACGSAATDANSNANSNTQLENGTAFEISLSNKLAIGTLKLEDTEFAVNSDQATNLLPLWQVLKTLTSSDTAAQEEINAVVDQIQETLTPEQNAAIDAMSLTNENMFTILQDLGLVQQQINASGTPQPGGNFQGGGPGSGGLPGSGPGGGGGPGGFGGEGGQLSPEQIATAQARRAENGGNNGIRNRVSAPLINAVIELLESKK